MKTPSLVETASVKTQETRGSNAGVHVGGVKDAREQSWRDEESEPEPTPEPVPVPEPAPRAPRTKGKRVIIEDSDDEPVDGKVNSDDDVDTSMGRLLDDVVPEQLPVRCRSRAPYEGDVFPSWTKYLQFDETVLRRVKDSDDMEFLVAGLTAVHLERNHRSSVFMTGEEFRILHECIW